MGLRILLAPLVSAALALAPAGLAQTPEEKETARALMDRGHERVEEDDLPGALEAFRSADEIMGVPTTGLARGKVLAALGRLTEAVDVLRRVARSPERPDEPTAFTEARAEATALDERLAERIPTLVLELPPTVDESTVQVTVDGRELSPAVASQPLRLDPGRHLVRVGARGHRAEERAVELAEGARRSVRFDLERVERPEEDPDEPTPEPDAGFRVPLVSWIAFGVSGAGAIAGAITGGLSLAKVSELEDACPGKTCDPGLRSDHDRMLALANGANASFAIAGAAALLGTVTLFTMGGEPERAGVVPVVGPTRTGLVVRF